MNYRGSVKVSSGLMINGHETSSNTFTEKNLEEFATCHHHIFADKRYVTRKVLEKQRCAHPVQMNAAPTRSNQVVHHPRWLTCLTTMQPYLLLSSCLFGVSPLKVYKKRCLTKNSHYLTATMFLELWKRKQAVIAWEWDLAGIIYTRLYLILKAVRKM